MTEQAEIQLEPMSEKEFEEYAERSCATFARTSPRYRDTNFEAALKEVREDFFSRIMPDGFSSKGHFLFNIINGNARVGYIHLAEYPKPGSKTIFAWDFEIFEPYRRQGFAKKAMAAVAKLLLAKGYSRVSLNVFGNNGVAIKLYESMGFNITQIQMSRELP